MDLQGVHLEGRSPGACSGAKGGNSRTSRCPALTPVHNADGVGLYDRLRSPIVLRARTLPCPIALSDPPTCRLTSVYTHVKQF